MINTTATATATTRVITKPWFGPSSTATGLGVGGIWGKSGETSLVVLSFWAVHDERFQKRGVRSRLCCANIFWNSIGLTWRGPDRWFRCRVRCRVRCRDGRWVRCRDGRWVRCRDGRWDRRRGVCRHFDDRFREDCGRDEDDARVD